MRFVSSPDVLICLSFFLVGKIPVVFNVNYVEAWNGRRFFLKHFQRSKR